MSFVKYCVMWYVFLFVLLCLRVCVCFLHVFVYVCDCGVCKLRTGLCAVCEDCVMLYGLCICAVVCFCLSLSVWLLVFELRCLAAVLVSYCVVMRDAVWSAYLCVLFCL